MEESITSDLTDVSHLNDLRNDIGSSCHSSKYPRRITPDDDDNAALDDDNAALDDDNAALDDDNAALDDSNAEDFDNFDEEEDRGDDDDYNPDSTNSRRKSSRLRDKVKEQIPLELRRDHMTVEEVAEEELRLQQQSRVKCQLNRETRSNAKGDTKVQFFHTFRGGRYEGNNCKVVLFRGFIFQASKKGKNGRYYWRCPLRPCKCSLTLLNDKFCSIAGAHDHPSNAEEVLSAIERRKKKKEREVEQREKRLAQLRQREIERRNRCVNGLVVEGNKNCNSNSNPNPNPNSNPHTTTVAPIKRAGADGLDELEAEEIDKLPTNLRFDKDLFNTFCSKMDRLFTEIHGYGLLQYDIKKDWDNVKSQIKHVTTTRIKIKDQRYRAMRMKLDKTIMERERAVESKRMMEERVNRLNVNGVELLINQIKELQGSNGIFEIINGQVISKDVDEYKVKYEKVVKERDLLRLKIHNLASAASSSLLLLGMETDADTERTDTERTDTGHPQEMSTQNSASSTSLHTQTTPVSRHLQNTSIVVNNSSTNHHSIQTTPILSIPSYSQTLQQPPFHGWQVM